jgi:hypothetical protein
MSHRKFDDKSQNVYRDWSQKGAGAPLTVFSQTIALLVIVSGGLGTNGEVACFAMKWLLLLRIGTFDYGCAGLGRPSYDAVFPHEMATTDNCPNWIRAEIRETENRRFSK